MEIRKATEQDYEAIVRLLSTREELFRVYPKGIHPFTVEQLRSLAGLRKELTVVTFDAKVVGFANLYNVGAGERAFVGNVVVAADCRGRGIGRRLVLHMLDCAFGKYRVREARISVFNDNTKALLLYAGLGFVPYAIEERSDPEGERVALIHMRLGRGDYPGASGV